MSKKYSILTVDLLGFGQSGKPENFDYSLESHAETVQLLLEHFTYRKIFIVAHSMGGAIAVLLAKRLSQIIALINVEGNLIPEDAGLISRQIANQSEPEFTSSGFANSLQKLKESNQPGITSLGSLVSASLPNCLISEHSITG